MEAFSTGFESDRISQCVLEPVPNTYLLRMREVVTHQPPRQQVIRQHAPDAANANREEDRIEDAVSRILPRPPRLSGSRYQRIEDSPFVVSQITGIFFGRTGICPP
jgi:hypothetical protein